MSKKTSVRNYGRIQNLFRHSVVIKIAMFLCLIALSSGWRKADTLGAAIGIGQQLVPAVLDAQKANSKGNNNDARSENELKWIEHIKNNPDSAIYAIGEYSRVYGKERAYSDEGKVESILDAIQYPEFSEDLEHIPLHKEEFYSGTSYPYILYKLGYCREQLVIGKGSKNMAKHFIKIDDATITPSLYVSNNSNYPALSFVFLGDAIKGESKVSCALFGIEQTFPEGTSIKDIGMRAKEKFNANFKVVARDEEVKEIVEYSPYSYTYSRSILMLTNGSTVVKLIGGNTDSFKSVKMDKEVFRPKFFNNSDVRMEIKSKTDFDSYDELKKAVEDPRNEYLPGFNLVRRVYESYNDTFDDMYDGNFYNRMLKTAKLRAGQVSLQIYDQNLLQHYLIYKTEADKMQQAEEEKGKAEEKAKKKAALEF